MSNDIDKIDFMEFVKENAAALGQDYAINWHITQMLKERGYDINTPKVNTRLNRLVREGLLTKKVVRPYCTQYAIIKNN